MAPSGRQTPRTRRPHVNRRRAAGHPHLLRHQGEERRGSFGTVRPFQGRTPQAGGVGQSLHPKGTEWLESGGPGKVCSIGKLRSMVREMLAEELREIDGLVHVGVSPPTVYLSLRGAERRSNLHHCLQLGVGDCFATLAMTRSGVGHNGRLISAQVH